MASGPYKFKFRRAALEAESECGSLSELAGILRDEGSALIKIFGSDMEMIVQGVSTDPQTSTAVSTGTVQTGTAEAGETNSQTTAEPTGRGRRKAKEAAAPAPLTIPAASAPPTAPAVPTAPVDMAPNAAGIPAGLVRDANNAAPAMAAAPGAAPPAPPAPPTPPAPPAPPAAPAAPPVPPTGVLAGKIIAAMDAKVSQQPESAQAWADWLATSGIIVAGATYPEACQVIRLQSDEKLLGLAAPLGIAA